MMFQSCKKLEIHKKNKMLIFSTNKQFIAIIKKYHKMICDLYEKVPKKFQCKIPFKKVKLKVNRHFIYVYLFLLKLSNSFR